MSFLRLKVTNNARVVSIHYAYGLNRDLFICLSKSVRVLHPYMNLRQVEDDSIYASASNMSPSSRLFNCLNDHRQEGVSAIVTAVHRRGGRFQFHLTILRANRHVNGARTSNDAVFGRSTLNSVTFSTIRRVRRRPVICH